MVHDFLAFDELDYSLTVMDVPDVMEAWDELDYPAKSICSLDMILWWSIIALYEGQRW
jgi:hypothetical protein